MSLKKSLAWHGAAQAISFALQFSSSVVLARYLTPHELGIFAVASATVLLVSLVQHVGLNALIVREEVLTQEISSTAFTVNALIACGLSLVIIAGSYGGSAFFRDEGVQRVLLVLAITPLLGIFSFLPGANLERTARFRELAIISTLTSAVGASLTIWLAVQGFSYMSIAYGQVAGSTTLAFALILVGRSHFSVRLGFTAWRRVSTFGVQMLAITGFTIASTRLSEILIGRILGLAALGLYSRASGMNNLLWGNFHYVIGRVMLVDFAASHRSGTSLRERYIQTVAVATAVLWPAFAGLAIIAEPLVVFVYGEQWAPAIVPFVYLAIASTVLVVITMTSEIFTATGELRAQTRIEFIRSLLSLLLFAAGCMISLEAAAATRVLEAVIAVYLYKPALNRITQTSLKDFLPPYIQGVVLTVVAVFPASLLMMLDTTNRPMLSHLLISTVLGILLWIAALCTMTHPLWFHISSSLRSSLVGRRCRELFHWS